MATVTNSRGAIPTRAQGLISTAAAITLVMCTALSASGCGGPHQGTPTPATQALKDYAAHVNRVMTEAFGSIDQIIQIFDDESYTTGLRANSSRFETAAKDINGIRPPVGFEAEHRAFAAAMDAAAEQMAKELTNVESGASVTDAIVSQTEGSLARDFEAIDAACTAISRKIDARGLYDAPSCGDSLYYIQAAEPGWSHRVYVNHCCGGSAPGSDPLEIFYGSDKSFEETAAHYKTELGKRGFTVAMEHSPSGGASAAYRFDKEGVPGCLRISEFTSDYPLFAVDRGKIAALADYPHAYVALWLLYCDG